MPIRLAYTLILVATLAAQMPARSPEGIPYVSPGIGIAWNSQEGFVIATKLSLGYCWRGQFLNLTFAVVTGFKPESRSVYVIETQFGGRPFNPRPTQTPILAGAGLGVTIRPDSLNTRISPRLSAFCGYFMFLTADVSLAHEPAFGFGLEAVAPIPLRRIVRLGD